MNKKSRQKFKYLQNEKSLLDEIAFFIDFQGLSAAKNCLRLEIVPLIIQAIKRGLLCYFTKTLKGRHFMGQWDGFEIFNYY